MATNQKAKQGEEKVAPRKKDEKTNAKANNEKKPVAKTPKGEAKQAAKR